VHWEFAIVDRLLGTDRLTIEGAEHLAAADAAGRPILLACLHLSNWEVIGIALSESGQRVSSIYQPPPNRFDHRIVVNSRRRWGWLPTPPGPGGARLAYRRLMQRQCALGIYIDECIDEHVFAPFFGRPLKLEGNIALIARLAAMTNAVVIPSYVIRREGAHFHGVFLPPIELLRGPDREADLPENVARINATIEPIIRKHLDQWIWLFDLKINP
jgi:KDO2-lipid IV(A) lauroyltransferase